MLDDAGIRPPIIAAGINLFGGPLGLIHRHVTGAMPIRRNTKDPAYLITLKAYVAELLQQHDLFFYPEGGRSYSGELKTPKTGLLHAALQARACPDLVIVPAAVAYDLVLEDHILARQSVKRAQRRVQPRAGGDGALRGRLPQRARSSPSAPDRRSTATIPTSRRDVLDLAHLVRGAIGRLYKVLPTAVLAAAMRPSITRRELDGRIDALLDTLRGDRRQPRRARAADEAIDDGAPSRSRRAGIIVVEGGRFRVRERTCCATTRGRSQHLLARRRDADARRH